MRKSIPERYCPKHGSQKVYVVCKHLLTSIGGQWTRNSEPIGTILPPREGWSGFIVCTAKEHEDPTVHAICEKCCLEQQLLLPEQLGRAWHLTLDGLRSAMPNDAA